MVRYTIHCILGNDILLRINVSGVATFDWCAFFGFMVHKIHLLFLFFPTARSCILDHRYDKYTHFFHLELTKGKKSDIIEHVAEKRRGVGA